MNPNTSLQRFEACLRAVDATWIKRKRMVQVVRDIACCKVRRLGLRPDGRRHSPTQAYGTKVEEKRTQGRLHPSDRGFWRRPVQVRRQWAHERTAQGSHQEDFLPDCGSHRGRAQYKSNVLMLWESLMQPRSAPTREQLSDRTTQNIHKTKRDASSTVSIRSLSNGTELR